MKKLRPKIAVLAQTYPVRQTWVLIIAVSLRDLKTCSLNWYAKLPYFKT